MHWNFVSLVATLLVAGVSGLRMVVLDVPAGVRAGDAVELSCVYELEQDRLYSIKWYRDDVEFYRYVPNDWPPGQFLPLPGVRVDLRKSGERSVHLRAVDLSSAGTYRCEVSAEAPSFQSVEAEAQLQVMVLPTEGPQISGGQSKFDVGDSVEINCTSAKSKPAATLRWFINDQSVSPEYQTEYPTSLDAEGLASSSLGLKFRVKQRHFSPDMCLRCTAAVGRHYAMSDEQRFSGPQSSPLSIDTDTDKPSKTGSKKKSAQQMSVQSSGSISSIYQLVLILPLLHWARATT